MNKTRVARSLLRVLNDAHQPLSRQEIARGLGKRYLMRHDIKVLNRLVEIDLVAGVKRVRWEVLDERFAGRYSGGRPDISKDIANGSVSWWYEITEAGAQVIQQADRWMERPASVVNQPRSQTRQPTATTNLAVRPDNQPRQPTSQSNTFDFDFDFDDIMIDLSDLPDIADDQPQQKESIIDRVMSKLEWFLNQK